MPRKAWVTEKDFQDAYSIKIRDPSHPQFGQTVFYGRLWAQRCEGRYDDTLTRFIRRRSDLVRVFSIGTTDRILIGGSGFGFLVDAFHDAGFSNTWGIDDSLHISTERSTETRSGTGFVEDEFLGVETIRTKLDTETGGRTFKWVITESLMESYEDAEMGTLLDAGENFLDSAFTNANIIHLVQSVLRDGTPDSHIDPIYNQKSLSQWKAVRPSHSWVDIVTFEVG